MRQPLGMHKAPDRDVVDLYPANLGQLGDQAPQGEVAAALAAIQESVPMEARQCRRLVTADLAVVEAAGGFELADPEVGHTDGDPEPGRGFVVRQAAF